jgi:hypothetical protein
MFARIASFEGGDDERLRQMNEERMSSGQMNTPAGMKSGMVLADRASGRRLFIALFEDEASLKAAEPGFEATSTRSSGRARSSASGGRGGEALPPAPSSASSP